MLGPEAIARTLVKDVTAASLPPNPSVDTTLAERGARYGTFISQACIAQDIKTTMSKSPKWGALKPDQRLALEMITVKISRILNGDPDYADNWHDIGGFAKLVEDRLNGTEK